MPKLTAKATKKQESEDMRAFGPIFNKDLGQHILKNPLVAQGIVDKVRSTMSKRRREKQRSNSLSHVG